MPEKGWLLESYVLATSKIISGRVIDLSRLVPDLPISRKRGLRSIDLATVPGM